MLSVLMSVAVLAVSPADPPEPTATRDAVRFEENRGQYPASIQWVARAGGLFATLGDRGFDLWVHQPRERRFAQVRLEFLGSAPCLVAEGRNPLPSRSHHFRGPSESAWHRDVAEVERVVYPGVWPGVDVALRPDGTSLAFDLLLAEFADPALAAFHVQGATVEQDGHAIALRIGEETLRLDEPKLFQVVGGEQQPVEGAFRMVDAHTFGFTAPSYDPTRPLVIDPTFVASTYFGGTSLDEIHGVTVDAAGDVYVTGLTVSPDLPLSGAFQGSIHGLYDAFVSKFDAGLSTLIYSTYLGGSGDFGWYERGVDIAVDSTGCAVVVGRTDSDDFPVAQAYQPTFGGDADAFITKLSPQGDSLIWSTYLGGSKFEQDTEGDFFVNRTGDLAIDSQDRVFVTGTTESQDLPIWNAWQPQNAGSLDAFVASFDADGTVRFVSYFGGSAVDRGWGLDLSPNGEPVIAGQTTSTDLPIGVDAWLTRGKGFVSRFSADGQALTASTYVPAEVTAVAVGPTGRVAFTGTTTDRCYPTTWAAAQSEHSDSIDSHPFDAYVTKLDAGLAQLYASTYFGTNVRNETGHDLAVDSHGGVWMTGSSSGHRGSSTTDAITILWNVDLTVEVDSARFGGRFTSAFSGQLDALDQLVIGGTTSSASYPTTPGVFQPTMAGGGDGFISILSALATAPKAITLENLELIPGASLEGRVTLNGRAPAGGASVRLTSSDPSVSVPGTVVVPSGDTSALFTVTASASAAPGIVTLQAQYSGLSAQFDLRVWQGPTYRLEFLGALDDSGSVASGINERGEIAGTSQDRSSIDRVVQFGAGQDVEELGGGIAGEINDVGQIAVERNSKMARYTPGVGIETLGTLPGGRLSAGLSVNDLGQVVGWSDGTRIQQHAVRYSDSVGMEDLGTLGGDLSQANDINDASQVAGWSFVTGNGAYRAFRHTDGTGLVDLGVLSGMSHSQAWGINEAGQVVGESLNSSFSSSRAFRYTDGLGLEDLGSAAGADRTVARAVNASGDVVGYTTGAGAVGPVLYQDSAGWITLSDQVSSRELFGWRLGQALDINDDGLIVGVGDYRLNGCLASAFRLVPCDARWNNYGTGWPGTQGVPSLTALQDPVLGQRVDVVVGNSRGAATSALVWLGFDEMDEQLGSGGHLYVVPFFRLPFALPPTGLTLSDSLPDDPSLHGLALYMQSLIFDPGATGDIALSPGLRLVLGSF